MNATSEPLPGGLAHTTAWKQHRASVHRYLRRRLPNKEQVEDLTQETFLRLYRAPPAISEPGQLRAWLFRIAHNLMVDYYRARRDEMPLDEAHPASAPDGTAPLRALEPCIAPLADRLPEGYRTALLWDLEGMPQQEIARRQNVSLSGAKSRVQRARTLLKREFERCCHFHFDADGELVAYGPRSRTTSCG